MDCLYCSYSSIHLAIGKEVLVIITLYQLYAQSTIPSGADVGFLREGAKPSSGSLMQGVWGAQPHKSYRLFGF